jgi:small subunit ribosomal protein S5
MEGEQWTPKTELGKLVASGEIKSMSEALKMKLPLREYQIVDILMPDLKDEIIYIERAQRMTDSGRRMNYSITAGVGN